MVEKENNSQTLIATFLIVFLLISSVFLNNALGIHKSEINIGYETYQVPNSIQKHLSFGYAYAISVLQWFDLVNTFGKTIGENKTIATYVNLAQRLDLITRLNPQAKHAYYMAATILPWATHSTKLSRPLLERAMSHMPDAWEWPYYEGFNAYWFDGDMKHAAQLMSHAAALPNSPVLVAKLAARMQTQNGNLEAALVFLQALLQQKQEVSFKIEVEKNIKQILTEKVLRQIDHILAHTPPAQRSHTLLLRLRKTFPARLPDGGRITFNQNGTPVSSKNKKRYQIFTPTHHQKAMP